MTRPRPPIVSRHQLSLPSCPSHRLLDSEGDTTHAHTYRVTRDHSLQLPFHFSRTGASFHPRLFFSSVFPDFFSPPPVTSPQRIPRGPVTAATTTISRRSPFHEAAKNLSYCRNNLDLAGPFQWALPLTHPHTAFRLHHVSSSHDIHHPAWCHLHQDAHITTTHQPAPRWLLQHRRQGPTIFLLLPLQLRPPRFLLPATIPGPTVTTTDTSPKLP